MADLINPKGSKHILFCHCGGERIHPELLVMVDEHLRKLPVVVTRLSDLCSLAAKKGNFASDLFKAGTEYLIIGCFPRTMNLLFDQIKEQNHLPDHFSYINLIDIPPADAIERINEFCDSYEGDAVYREITEDSGWPSWYPVIDYNRCTACGQCADFCLFGVYEKNKSRVQVVNPMGCKNNCPACARICPQTAIIFPKYKQGGAIGGSEQIDELAEQTRQSMDIREILRGDVYSAIEQRKQKRQSIILQETMRKAQEERDKAIQENKEKRT